MTTMMVVVVFLTMRIMMAVVMVLMVMAMPHVALKKWMDKKYLSRVRNLRDGETTECSPS
jgi:hypothetical protein